MGIFLEGLVAVELLERASAFEHRAKLIMEWGLLNLPNRQCQALISGQISFFQGARVSIMLDLTNGFLSLSF